jgi:hypothetical protein
MGSAAGLLIHGSSNQLTEAVTQSDVTLKVNGIYAI